MSGNYPSAKQQTPPYLIVGEVLRPHGIRGELRMRVLTDYPERIPNLKYIYLGQDPHGGQISRYTVQHMRMHKTYGLLKLEGVDDRDQADLLRELMVMVSIDDAIPLEDDEVYLYQLIGLTVHTSTVQEFGVITDVLETGANDVYVVKSDHYGEVLIPIIDGVVLETNLEEGFMRVQLPEGLLPEK